MRRSFSLATVQALKRSRNETKPDGIAGSKEYNDTTVQPEDDDLEENKTVLTTEYKATTNRMLRVAVNGFMESLGVVLGVMEELDVDVLESLKVEQT